MSKFKGTIVVPQYDRRRFRVLSAEMKQPTWHVNLSWSHVRRLRNGGVGSEVCNL